jgi:hypothetical protein
MPTHSFSCSSGPGTVSTKNASGPVMSNLCFCIEWDMKVMYRIPVHPGAKMSTHYFSCSGELGAVCIKNAPGHHTSYLCFCIRWDLWIT